MPRDGAWLELVTAHYAGECRDIYDMAMVFVHWCFVRRGFTNVGMAPADVEMTPARVAALLRDAQGGSELLPRGWNAHDGSWSLVYKLPAPSNDVVLVKGVRIEAELSLHALRPGSDDVRSLSVEADRMVGQDFRAKPETLFKRRETFQTQVDEGIVRPFLPPTTSNSTKRHDDDDDDDDLLRPTSSNSGFSSPGGVGAQQPRVVDPLRDYGRADLDPFSNNAGGMIFDPLRVGQGRGGPPGQLGPDGRPLPPGAVPPGARFDPFAPFGQNTGGPGTGRGRGFGPDPDHERPPGSDDMFM